MREVTLAEVTLPIKTWNPAKSPDELFEYVDLSSIDNSTKQITSSTPTVGASAPSRARQLIAHRDVLVSTVRPNLNAVARVPPSLDGATASTGFSVLRPSEELDDRYLFHWVRTPVFVSELVRNSTGSTYPAVSERTIRQSRLPLPTLPEQRRLAKILDQAENLLRKRATQVSMLNGLAHASFIEAFGSSRRGGVGSASFAERLSTGDFPLVRLDSVADIHGGGRLGLSGQHFVDQGVPAYGAGGLNGCVEQAEYEDRDAVILSAIGARCGKCFLARGAWTTLANTQVILPREGIVDVDYLWYSLNDEARWPRSGSAQPFIKPSDVKAHLVPLPPLELQREFASLASEIRSVRATVERAVDIAGELFASLQMRAFSGML